MSFVLKQLEIGPMQNFIYLIVDEKSKQSLVVDPAWEGDKIISVAYNHGVTLAGLVVTHSHYDHSNAINEILKKLDIPVYANKEEIEYSKSNLDIVAGLGASVKPLGSEDKIMLGETEITVFHTPGHTPGSQCLRVGNYLITGDTLFIGGCGRTDLPGGNPTALFQSLQKIATLPSELMICPGHDYGRAKQLALGREKEENPYLKLHTQDAFIDSVSI